jgi:hypothetical protein
VVVPFNDQVVAQRELRPYLSTTGDKSIRAALMADQTLGGAVFGLEVARRPNPVRCQSMKTKRCSSSGP